MKKSLEEQIQDLVVAIEKKEGDITALQSKLTALVRQQFAFGKKDVSESAPSQSQLLQE
jgi:hypothetical protein